MENFFILLFSMFLFISFLLHKHDVNENLKKTNEILEINTKLIKSIHDEMKDFHKRMCNIERGKK
jgi:large-conductance mechanosensitive channel